MQEITPLKLMGAALNIALQPPPIPDQTNEPGPRFLKRSKLNVTAGLSGKFNMALEGAALSAARSTVTGQAVVDGAGDIWDPMLSSSPLGAEVVTVNDRSEAFAQAAAGAKADNAENTTQMSNGLIDTVNP
jgi:hypothetical protein